MPRQSVNLSSIELMLATKNPPLLAKSLGVTPKQLKAAVEKVRDRGREGARVVRQ